MNKENCPTYIRKVRNFTGPDGERIEEMSLCFTTGRPMTDEDRKLSNIEEPLYLYSGVVSSLTPVLSPTGEGDVLMSHILHDLRFEIKADNIGEAFDKYSISLKDFESSMREAQEKMIQEEESKLVVPDAVESKSINEDLRLIHPD